MNAVHPVPFRASSLGRQRLALLAGLLLLLQLAVQPALTSSTQLYVVVQSAPALAAYSGGIDGLAATSPEARGERKLEPDSAASRAYLDFLVTERADLLLRAAAAVGREVVAVDSYNFALNGFSARLTAAEANRLAALPGVAFVAANETLYTLTDAGPQWMNADDAWDGSATGVASKGEGIVAGIIDTGVNPTHPSFAAVGPVDGYAHSNPRTRFYGVCAGAVVPAPTSQCNNKLIGLYDFVGGGAAGSGVVDDVGHGSHTASTVAGNVVDATLVAPTTTLAARRISGVAPHANIISYKACQAAALPQLGACPLNALVAAIDAATADVVDVINFSIGGGSVDPWADPLGMSFFGAHAAGIFVAASAGNNGPNPQTIGRPSNSPWLLSVGASTHTRRPTGTVTASKANGASVAFTGMTLTSGLAARPLIDARDLGNELCDPFSGAAQAQIAGKIVICTQGVIGRVQKGVNVQAGGGAGMILVSQAGYKNSVVSDTHVVPTVMIGELDGAALREWLAGAQTPQATITGVDIQTGSALADRMAGFSSRGPDLASPNVIKPDVTAPGVAILAAWMNEPGRAGDDYQMIQGTSMSSPHAAGAGALIAALHPSWTPDQIKSALMSTAFTVPDGGKETVAITKEDHATPSDPFDRGGGRIDVAAAARAGFTVDESLAGYMAANPAAGGQSQTLNLASLASSSCSPSCSWTRTLTSTASSSRSYTVSVTDGAGFDLSVSPASFTLAAGGTQTITITATNTGLLPDRWQFGEVRFAASSGPAQHFPVAVTTGGGEPIEPDCSIPETVVSSAAASPAVPPYNDVTEVAVAGLYPTLGGEAIPNVAFRMRVTELGVNGALPPNQFWRVSFVPPAAAAGTTYFVQLWTDQSSRPSFGYGTITSGFSVLGAVESGTYDLDTNDIKWTIAASKITNPQVGQTLNGVNGDSGPSQPGTLTLGIKSTPENPYTLTTCGATPTPTVAPTPTGGTDNRATLTFQGNLDEGCTGDGRADIVACDGPFLRPDATLDANPAARWIAAGGSDVDGTADRNIYDPNWIWHLDQPTTLAGRMTVEFWGQCNGCVGPFAVGQWTIRLFADSVLVVEKVAAFELANPALPTRLTVDVDVPSTTADTNYVLQVDPYYSDAQDPSLVLYDGQSGCGGDLGAACDSLVRMPVGGAEPTPTPTTTLPPTPSPTVAPTAPPTPAPLADLLVSAMSASEQKAKAGDRIVVSATVHNGGSADAPATRTEFRFADGTFLGAADTPAIAAGSSATVSVGWDTRGANGDYTITAAADTTAVAAESNESNNSANLHLAVRGNKVQNQSYEQPNSDGSAPESWQGQSTGAGTTSYNQGSSSNSSDGSASVSITGTGRSVALHGLPTWSSAPFAVNPGELLTVSVDVHSVGLSSAPSLGLAYLGPAGELLNTVKVLSAPLSSTGFSTLSSQLRVPPSVASVRLVLAGFAATDTRTSGSVTFDNVGVWGE